MLDDGWFRGRRHRPGRARRLDRRPGVWPEGLHPLVDEVKRLGMEFGLWVEPEMVNEDSDLARAHPDWVLRGRADLPPEWRHQQVLDLQAPGRLRARAGRAAARCSTEYDIAYLKWDHNRDLIDVAHAGRPAVHGQTLAFYRLLDELRAAHPDLEIETCASGGGRVDLEVLTRTDRVWPSDTIDAVERQRIQRWTSLLVPPEMLGAHVGGPVAHTTGRTHRLELPGRDRAARPLRHRVGPARARRRRPRRVAAWVALHKRVRPVLVDAAGWCAATTPTPRSGHRRGGRRRRRGAGTSWRRSTPLVTQSPAAVLAARARPGPHLPADRGTRRATGTSRARRALARRGAAYEVTGAACPRSASGLPAPAPESAYVLRARAPEPAETRNRIYRGATARP